MMAWRRMRWVSVEGVSWDVPAPATATATTAGLWERTFKLSDVHAEGIALFQHALAAALDKVVEALRELGHALAQVVEAEVDRGQGVGHGGRVGGVLCLGAGEGRAEAAGCCWDCGHCWRGGWWDGCVVLDAVWRWGGVRLCDEKVVLRLSQIVLSSRVREDEVEVPNQNNQRQGSMSDLATLKEYRHSETSSIVKTDASTWRNMIFNGRTNILVFTSWLC
jgi:hypothetical protein